MKLMWSHIGSISGGRDCWDSDVSERRFVTKTIPLQLAISIPNVIVEVMLTNWGPRVSVRCFIDANTMWWLKNMKKHNKNNHMELSPSCFRLGDDNSEDSDHCLPILSMLVLTSCAVLFFLFFFFLFSKKNLLECCWTMSLYCYLTMGLVKPLKMYEVLSGVMFACA